MSGLFTPGAPRLYSIPPGANFLDQLAAALADATGLKDNPEALADTLIYVPNNRSKTALAFALYQASGRGACLLPDIRALGDLESEEPPPSVEAALADLPPAIPTARRIGELTKLVMAYYQAQDFTIPAASALSAARELARLLDQAALSGKVDWDQLNDIVTDQQLAQHWEQSLAFLNIITEQWPVKLDDAQQMDPYARRFAAAQAMAQAWAETPPQTPVIIAGSTGATPASRILMQTALTLPQGLVVLPGLDRDLPAEVWDSLPETPSHPQFTLARTLASLDTAPANVALWPNSDTAPARSARRRLIHEALAPAASTADWTQRLSALADDGDPASFVKDALQGLTLIEAADDTDEAMLAALLLRETLQSDSQTAALVTPDAGLARQVSALLRQWNIAAAPSAGLPLLQTLAGSFAHLVMDWLTDPSHPVKLMAMLSHEHCRFDRAAISKLDQYVLRGPRYWDSLQALSDDLSTRLKSPPPEYSHYKPADLIGPQTLLTDLQDLLTQSELTDPAPFETTGPDWFTTSAAMMAQLASQGAPWTGDDGASLSKLLSDLADMADPLGLQPPHVFNDLFQAEATLATVSSGEPHPRLAIWGPLEARLQTADRIILAGLNEGIWPAQPPADAFLPRVFRSQIGLADPDERIGLSAHDFAQLAAAPQVTLLTSKRRDEKPVVASRWIWRLRTLARSALDKPGVQAAFAPPETCDPQSWLTVLQQALPRPKGFTAEPRPTPPLEARPTGLSVTRIEALVRDPYAIYCQYVLGLHRLDPLNLPGDVRIRGTAIHKALELFEEDGSAKTPDGLLALLEAELRGSGEPEAALIALRETRRTVAADYIAWRADTAHNLEGKPIREERGEITLEIAGQPFTLSGTADRIEKRVGGSTAILDFKSGLPPSEKQVRSGMAPQMPLQGLIAMRGGYARLGKTDISALTYIQFGSKFNVTEIGKPGTRDEKPIADIIAETEQGLIDLLTCFADPSHPYLSAPRPQRVTYWSDYTRLARRQEWARLSSYD